MNALYLPQRPLMLIAAFARHETAIALAQNYVPFDPEQLADLRVHLSVLGAKPGPDSPAPFVAVHEMARVVCSPLVLPPHGRMNRLSVLRRGGCTRVLLGFSSPLYYNRFACLDASAYPPRYMPLEESGVLYEAMSAILGPASVPGQCTYAAAPAAWGLGAPTWLVLAHARDRETRRAGYPFGRRTLHWLDADRMVVTRSMNLPDLDVLRFAAIEPELALRADDPDHFSLVVDDLDTTVRALRFCLRTGKLRSALCYSPPPANPGDRSPMTVPAPGMLPLPGDRWLVIPSFQRLPSVMAGEPCEGNLPLGARRGAVPDEPGLAPESFVPLGLAPDSDSDSDSDDDSDGEAAPQPAAALEADPTLRLEGLMDLFTSGEGICDAKTLRDAAQPGRTLIFLARGAHYALAEFVDQAPPAVEGRLRPAGSASAGLPEPEGRRAMPLLRLLHSVCHGRATIYRTSLHAVGEDEIYVTYTRESDVISARNGRLEIRTAPGRTVAHCTHPDTGLAVVLAQIARQKEARFAAHGAALAALAGAAGM